MKIENIPVLITDPNLTDAQRTCLTKSLQTPSDLHEQLLLLGRDFRVKVVFSSPVEIQTSHRHRTKPETVHTFPGFFRGRSSTSIVYAFRRPMRTGFYWDERWDDLVVSIEPVMEKDPATEIKALGRCIHPNAWPKLRKDCEVGKDDLKWLGHTRVDIRRKFPEYVIVQVKNAFETKTAYSYRQSCRNGVTGRDLSIEVKPVDIDGQTYVQAWFSSEFPGCGNGSYYLLLNPTTASFREDD